MLRVSLLILAAFCGCLAVPWCTAQNVTNYSALSEPHLYLLLCREPAVHDDLQLSPQQRQQLGEVNAQLDGRLLASRNLPQIEAQGVIAKLHSLTVDKLTMILDELQQRRLAQIARRVRGLAFLRLPQIATELDFSSAQQAGIVEILNQLDARIAELRHEVEAGGSRQAAEAEAMDARQQGQREILNELTAAQKAMLPELLGSEFDSAKLGQASFRGPDLVGAQEWINSQPVKLSDLRGQVVVVHFFAFQCINCQRNYPCYLGWQESFAERDFQMVGIHTPETSAESDVSRLRRAVADAGFTFPVVADNRKQLWGAWGNSMWPSVYLVDKHGFVRYWWYGELNWQGAEGEKIMRARIEQLLAEDG